MFSSEMSRIAATAPALSKLSPEERARYDDLRFNRIGSNLRPEQERIPFGWMRRRLDRLQIGLVGCCVPGVDSPAH